MSELKIERDNVSYPYIIKSSFLSQIGLYLKTITSKNKILIISDENTHKLYGDELKNGIITEGFECLEYVIRITKDENSFKNVYSLLEFLASNNFLKSDIIVSLGSTIIENISSFLASIYKKGMRLVHIPTTLLAGIDTAISGDNEIFIDDKKSICGTHYEPLAVYLDADVLKTLVKDNLNDGLIKIISYALFFDEGLFKKIESTQNITEELEDIITQYIKSKNEIKIEEDEKDALFIGEIVSSFMLLSSDTQYSFSSCYAFGLVSLLRSSIINGICTQDVLERFISLLEKNQIEYNCQLNLIEFKNYIENEITLQKKYITLRIPYSIGESKSEKISIDKLDSWIQL